MKCDHCGKAPVFGHKVSHAKNRTRRQFRPNLQKVSVMEGNKKVQKILCAKCIKALSKIKD
ncbi:MAG TPA: 50S ribosomal protein L28 [Anaerolineales bacterium]|nr:50S ribosomal protein L28 [Anaerolineales bacterium]